MHALHVVGARSNFMKAATVVHALAAQQHRPSNVDDDGRLKKILQSLLEVNAELTVVFPVHPRTRQRLARFGLDPGQLQLLEPLPYIEFLALQRHATVVITDSGGIQEETTYLNVPCITLSKTTERPITANLGTNVLVGQDVSKLQVELDKIRDGKAKRGQTPPL